MIEQPSQRSNRAVLVTSPAREDGDRYFVFVDPVEPQFA
jgi:hypothetical protein